MTALVEQQAAFAAPSDSTPPISPSKDAPNPQQGMSDPAASVSAATAATVTNTACTSPLTITSLEAAAAAGTAAADKANGSVPEIVSQVLPVPIQAVPTVESVLAPMAGLGIDSAPPPAIAAPPLPIDDKKMRGRTPPTEHDNRKLFVGGLPTDGERHAESGMLLLTRNTLCYIGRYLVLESCLSGLTTLPPLLYLLAPRPLAG